MFLGSYPTYTQLPPITSDNVARGDAAYTMDDGALWFAVQPSSPVGVGPQWNYVDTMRGAPGPQGPPGIGFPGPQGQMGPAGSRGSQGPQGPPGQNAFSYTALMFQMPPIGGNPVQVAVTDTSWMVAGQLVYIPNAGTFTVIGSPIDANTVMLANSGDANNAVPGTLIPGGSTISMANMRGPIGPAGVQGPQGNPGPQGVAGAAAYTVLVQDYTIPATQSVAFVQNAGVMSVGLIVYVGAQGGYFSVLAVNTLNNTITLQNLSLPGGSPIGTLIPSGTTISGVGPQGPAGPQGIPGPQGPQGLQGVAPAGTITMYAGTVAPGGWLLCQGQPISRTGFSALWAICGTTYGAGNGTDTFNLPNMCGRFPLGLWPGGSWGAALNSPAGENVHTLVTAETPGHSHTITASDGGHAHVVPVHGHGWNDNNHWHYIPAHGHGWNDNSHSHYFPAHSHSWGENAHQHTVPAHSHGFSFGDPGHTHGYTYWGSQDGNFGGPNLSSKPSGPIGGTTGGSGTNLGPYLGVQTQPAFATGNQNQGILSAINAYPAYWAYGNLDGTYYWGPVGSIAAQPQFNTYGVGSSSPTVVGSVANCAAFWSNTGYASITTSCSTVGSNQAHNNMPPYIVLNYIIKT